jgi:NADH dehydrogenase
MKRPAPRAPPARRGARAVADLGALRRSGFRAWRLCSFAHLWFLVGFRNRILVFIEWALAYATFDRGARLITEQRSA